MQLCVTTDNDTFTDAVTAFAFTIGDASTLIKGLLGLQKCNHLAFRGVVVSNSYAFQCALDDVLDTIEKYQNK